LGIDLQGDLMLCIKPSTYTEVLSWYSTGCSKKVTREVCQQNQILLGS